MTHIFIGRSGIGVIEIVYNIACSTGDNNSIKRMMSMIEALLAEPNRQCKRHVDLEKALAFTINPLSIIVVTIYAIETFKTRCYDTIPNIIEPPVFF